VGEVTMTIDEGVAVMTISSPEVKNGLTADMCLQLIEHCDVIDADVSVGAAVIRGAGGTFCSGADTRAWSVMVDPASEEAFKRSSEIFTAFQRVGHLKVPTVAAVRGAAVGAGMILYLVADVRIVALNARIIAGFLRVGIHPGGGFFTLVGRLAGREAGAALGLFGEEVSGEQAARIGLAWEAVPDEMVEGRAVELAKVATRDPELTRQALASYRTELGPPQVSWQAALEMERGIQMWSQRRRQTRLQQEDS